MTLAKASSRHKVEFISPNSRSQNVTTSYHKLPMGVYI